MCFPTRQFRSAVDKDEVVRCRPICRRVEPARSGLRRFRPPRVLRQNRDHPFGVGLVEPCDGDVVCVGVVEVDVDVAGADESWVAGVPNTAEKNRVRTRKERHAKRRTTWSSRLG
jgi:hypothetical protein